MIFSGLEKFGYILYFRSPGEILAKLINRNESITLSNVSTCGKHPSKNEICKQSKFIIEHNSDYVFCEILEDLKYDEIFCQIILCNSDIQLKVDYRRLIFINPKDVFNDDNCINFKLHDFYPIFPNGWSSDLIQKLENLLIYNKFIFQYKSSKADPTDGLFPINLLRVVDRQLITKQFIDDKTASCGSEYYKLTLENEISQIFLDKRPNGFRYRISVPLVKKSPIKYEKMSPNKVLNIEAKPFTPNIMMSASPCVESIKPNLIQPNTAQPLNEIQEKNSCFKFTTPSAKPTKANSDSLATDIVNMFSQMYRNHQTTDRTDPSAPFSKYKSVFPNYGGVNFTKPKISTSLNTTSYTTNKITNSYSISTNDNGESTLYYQSESCSTPVITKHSLKMELPDKEIDIKSIPLPPTTSSQQTPEPISTPSYIISAAPVMYSISPTTVISSVKNVGSPSSLSTDSTDSLSASLNSLSLTGNRFTLDNHYNQSTVLTSFPLVNANHYIYNNPFSVPPAHATILPSFNVASFNQMILHPPPSLPTATIATKLLDKWQSPPSSSLLNKANDSMGQFQQLQFEPTIFQCHDNPADTDTNFFNKSISCPISASTDGRIEFTARSKNVNFPESKNSFMNEPATFPGGVWIPTSGTFRVQPINIIHYTPN